jgi:hypothetical protein
LAVKSTVDRDKIYAVTSYSDNLALYYNKNILKQAQIPLPPASWNELNGQLNSLNKRNLNNDFDQSAISMGTGLKIKNGDVDMDSNISNFEEILPTLILQSGGQIYDTAGSAIGGGGANAGQRFVANLDKHSRIKSKGGRYRSRVMYPATKKYLPLIEKAVEVSIRKIDGQVQKRLNG